MNDKTTTVICMTPTKNEEWIIERFIQAASLWADVIIIADQMSSDRTVEIAQRYSKVRVIYNESKEFNENERQKMLINEARKILGKKLLVALDADEFLTGNFSDSPEWNKMLNAEPGTIFHMRWPFITQKYQTYWEAEEPYNIFAMLDDGSQHIGSEMHSVRLPIPEGGTNEYLNDIAIMHFQYTDWKRMESKHQWYQFYERVHYPEKSVFQIYRMYHHMYNKHHEYSVPVKWFERYQAENIDLNNHRTSDHYWWDAETAKYIEEYGADYFRYIDQKTNGNIVLYYLRLTQHFYISKLCKAIIRRLDVFVEFILLGRKYYEK